MRQSTVFLLAFFAASSVVSAADRDPLALARALYNQHRFEAAIEAADQARATPARADSADLVAARSYLERYRQTAIADDLTKARERLRRLDPRRLAASERDEYLVGLGEALYLDGTFGAAADVFSAVIAGGDRLEPDARERVLDWWASAVDRDARPRGEIDRSAAYQRIRDRMQAEIAGHPWSAVSAYWLSAAARGQGDLQAAWDAAQAAWVRAPLAPDKGVALRADVDRLVQRAIIPDRAKTSAQPPQTFEQEWERFKDRWKQ